jgi:hypothetical protein
MLVKVINAHRMLYSDQTGRFPVQSSRGHKLLMIIYKVNGNYINTEPVIDSNQRSLIQAYQSIWARLTASGNIKPTMHILDNEALQALKDEIRDNCKLQLVPLDTHQQNLVERAIQTFKSHFIAILSSVDENFPMN